MKKITLLSIVFCLSLNIIAQDNLDINALSCSIDGVYSQGYEVSIKKEYESITFVLNANSEYILAVKGQNVSFEIEGIKVSLENDRVNIITSNQPKNIRVVASPNKKNGKLIAVLHYIKKVK